MGSRFAPASARERLIVALDLASPADAEALVAQLGRSVGVYKVGMELVFSGGLDLVHRLTGDGKQVFLDMKLLDIDNTVTRAVEAITRLGVRFTTIHGYPQAMRAAVAARGEAPLALLAVTVLTSMDEGDLAAAGYGEPPEALVKRRARDARAAGMDGIVCSPREASLVRAQAGPDLLIVTPGVRPAGAAAGDQKRVTTPGEAIAAGADYLVVGRPVIRAPDPRRAAEAIVADIDAGLESKGT
jgi:orotidine-5'-phosphate decarboxylase